MSNIDKYMETTENELSKLAQKMFHENIQWQVWHEIDGWDGRLVIEARILINENEYKAKYYSRYVTLNRIRENKDTDLVEDFPFMIRGVLTELAITAFIKERPDD